MGLNPKALRIRREIGDNGMVVGVPWGPGSKAGIQAIVNGGGRHGIVLPQAATEGAMEIALSEALGAPNADLLTIGGGFVADGAMAELGARLGLPYMASKEFVPAVAEVCAREGIGYFGNADPKNPDALAQAIAWQLEHAPADGDNLPFVSLSPFAAGDHCHVAENIERFGDNPGVRFIAVGALSLEGTREGSLIHTLEQPFFQAVVLRLAEPTNMVNSAAQVRRFNEVISGMRAAT